MIFTQVDPEKFIDVTKQTPYNGRGAWTKQGIEFGHRYGQNPESAPRIGTQAEKSLSHWAVAAGTWAIQARLIRLGFMVSIADTEKGIFGPKTKAGVVAFQKQNVDPENNSPLFVDGIVGMSDARSLFTPLIHTAERKYGIPDHFLIGQTRHESALDPGAIGYYIFYPDYRGVDRALSQINSKANLSITWQQAFNPVVSIEWSAKRLQTYYELYKGMYPKQTDEVLWDAAVCAHNNPTAGRSWAKYGFPQTESAASYVNAVKAARY